MKPLREHAPAEVKRALRGGRLVLELGPFAVQLETADVLATDFFLSMYRDCCVSLDGNALADFGLKVRPPNLVRRFVRRQIIPDPGFRFPTVPVPPRMSPLALEMGMNLSVAMQCFRYSIFHAGVVADDKGAIVISAHSGGGKSTLTAALMQEGFRLLSDEFAIMALDSAEMVPYPRPVSLKNASIDIVTELAGEGEMSATLSGTPKGNIGYRRARASDIAQAGKHAPAKLMLFPKFVEGATAKAEPVSRADAITRFIAGSPNYHIIGEAAFNSLMKCADGLVAYDITYGSTEDSVALVRELWEAIP